jgi:hypothetical protein
MVGHSGYDRLDQDEHNNGGALNYAGLDSPRQLDEYVDSPESDRAAAPASAVASSSRSAALQIHTGATQTRARHTEKKVSKKVVAWRDLPKKDQLLVITLARLSEPLTQTSLQVSFPTSNPRGFVGWLLTLLILRPTCSISYNGVSKRHSLPIWAIFQPDSSTPLVRGILSCASCLMYLVL